MEINETPVALERGYQLVTQNHKISAKSLYDTISTSGCTSLGTTMIVAVYVLAHQMPLRGLPPVDFGSSPGLL